jgi:hypothetical protein
MRITQKDLLSEGFWDNFKTVANGVKTTIGEVGKVVAPEIANPVTNIITRGREMKDKISKAFKNKNQNALDFLHDRGFFILPDEKIHWGGKGDNVGVVQVGELDFSDDGTPKLGGLYNNPRLVFQYDAPTKGFKIIKQPYRHTARPVTVSS